MAITRFIKCDDQICEYIHILNLKVNEKSVITKEPIEDGTPIADNKIREPIVITMSVMIEQKDANEALPFLDDLYHAPLSSSISKVKIYADGRCYSNMVLVSKPYEVNNAEKFDHYYLDLEFNEVLVSFSKDVVVPISYANSSTAKTGEVGATKES